MMLIAQIQYGHVLIRTFNGFETAQIGAIVGEMGVTTVVNLIGLRKVKRLQANKLFRLPSDTKT